MDESWVSVAQYSDAKSASFASGQLAAGNISSEISRIPLSGNIYDLRVPPESADAAKQVLESYARIDEKELTRLALAEPPPDDYVPSETTSTNRDAQARRMSVMMPIFSGVLFFVSTGFFVVALARMRKDPLLPLFCTAGGCQSVLTLVIISGLLTLVMLGALLASVRGGKQDK